MLWFVMISIRGNHDVLDLGLRPSCWIPFPQAIVHSDQKSHVDLLCRRRAPTGDAGWGAILWAKTSHPQGF